MPVFNGERYLRASVESILNQTLCDLELVVVNDGSTDSTSRILRDFASKDPRVRVLDRPKQGLVESLNEACHEAAAPYIARMDADDVSIAERLALQWNYLETNPQVVLVGSSVIVMNEEGQAIDNWPYSTESSRIKKRLLKTNCFAHPTIMMRKWAFEAVGGYRNAFLYAEDYDLWLRIAEHYEVANLVEPTLFYRVHGQQISMQQLKKRTISTLAAQVSAKGRHDLGYDPFSGTEKLTSEVLCRFGFTSAEIQNEFIDAFLGALSLLLKSNQRTGLDIIKETQSLLRAESISRSLTKSVAAKILSLAYHFYSHHRYGVSKELLKLCVRLDGSVLVSKKAIRLAAKLALGERRTNIVTAIKRRLARLEFSSN